jgi:hypothetical protein
MRLIGCIVPSFVTSILSNRSNVCERNAVGCHCKACPSELWDDTNIDTTAMCDLAGVSASEIGSEADVATTQYSNSASLVVAIAALGFLM